ncbi:MAG: hypothetical protein ACLRZ2_00945 [Veillonella sp.]
MLIGMAFTTILAMVLGLTKVPISSSDIFNLVPPFPVDTFGQLDVMSAIGYGFSPLSSPLLLWICSIISVH